MVFKVNIGATCCNLCCNKYRSYIIGFLILLFFNSPILYGQTESSKSTINSNHFISKFNPNPGFIQNIGQYGDTLKGFGYLGKIVFAFEGFDMPVLFTEKGIIHLHRSIQTISEEEREKLEKMGVKPEIIAQKTVIKDTAIVIEFLGSNIPSLDYSNYNKAYHTYFCVEGKAASFRKVVYKNIYEGIDLIFEIDSNTSNQFEYSFLVHPLADVLKIKMHVKGDLKRIYKSISGDLNIYSSINGFKHSKPISYYTKSKLGQLINSKFQIQNSILSFDIENVDSTREYLIDPFVSSTSNLTGANSGKAKDVDFDYTGNVFVTGGGDGSIYKLAKYNSSGTLQWTFSGSLTVPAWNFGTYYGGLVIDKTNGNAYLGQGFAPGGGFKIIRLNASGNYDNYISTANASFMENWKMLWSCNSGSPQIIIAGGGTNSNINLGVVSPPSTSVSGINLTNIAYNGSSGWAQDVSDIVIDPVNNDLFSIYGSLFGTPGLSNKIYKNNYPYSSTSSVWNVASGYTVIQEIANRPYLVAGQIDNSSNIFAVNSNYLFYYDGLNLKAFNKSTGAAVGTAITLSGNTALMQGGIVADECNNIFVGSTNGVIKVYTFNGTNFNDSTPDLSVSGFSSSSIYDLVLSDARKILYASGNGFVASFNVANYACNSNVYTLSVSSNCGSQSATASLSPAPPQNSSVTYQLYAGGILISSNQNGVFSNLTPTIAYTLYAYINQSCSGIEAVKSFTIPGLNVSVTQTNATCGNANGSIVITASGGSGTLRYSINGITFQNSNTFSGLVAGIYTVTVKDSVNCPGNVTVLISNSNGPSLSGVVTNAFCGAATGKVTLTGSGTLAPYQYKLSTSAYRSGNIFDTLSAGTYVFYVKDSNNCYNIKSFTILSNGSSFTNSVKTKETCGNSNASFSFSTNGGTAPYLYSINNGAYQNAHVFTGLKAGVYTIKVKDSLSCISTFTDTLFASSNPSMSIATVSTSCNGLTGKITITASGGTSPYQYSKDGGSTYQGSNVFNNLNIGTYSISIKDANNCINTGIAVITKTYPQITDTTTTATCASFNGTIRAIGTGGTTPYRYSLDGVNYRSGNLFQNLQSGTYTLYIKDTAGCVNSVFPVKINNTSGLSINATSSISSCAANTGTISISASGGTSPFTYSIDSINYQSSSSFSSLAPGTYVVRVKDANNCISRQTIVVGKLQGPSATISTINANCNNAIGKVIVAASGGKSPYTYSSNGTTFQSGSTLKGLAAGTYTITVKDSNLCITTVSATISSVGSTTGPTVTASTTDAECGMSTGRINGNGSGGKNPKKYSIDGVNYQGSNNFSNLPPGNYTLYVIDDNGCTNEVSVTVGNVTGPQVSAVDSSSLCGSSTGKLTLTGSNGTAPYKFSIDNGVNFQNSNVFTGLAPGFYTVMVRDNANVCKNSIVVKIKTSNGPSISLSKKDATCGINNGTITVTATGGNGTKKYSLDGINFQTSNSFTGLSQGDYAITVKDSLGCSNSETITVGALPTPTVSATQVPESCNHSDGRIRITAGSGTSPYRYSLDSQAYRKNANYSNLKAGYYKVNVIDTIGCVVSTTITVNSVSGPILSSKQFSTTCNRSNGAVLITGSSGTMQYQYSLNGSAFGQSFLFDHLNSGTKYIQIKDSNNCMAYDTIIVTSKSVPSITLIEDTLNCSPGYGTIVVTVSGGTSPYSYSIDSVNYQNSNRFNCLQSGTYKVYLKDSNVCSTTNSIAIKGVALSVNLLEFAAIEEIGQVKCNWTISDEENTQKYLIERSADLNLWENVCEIEALKPNGNLKLYSCIDEQPLQGYSYYKLSEIETNGSRNELGIEQVHFGSDNTIIIEPNPAHHSFVIKDELRGNFVIRIFNIEGVEQTFEFYQLQNGINVSTENWSEGVYLVNIETNSTIISKKLLVIHH